MRNGALRRLQIGPRLVLCFGVIIVSVLGTNGLLFWQFRRIRAQAEHLSAVDAKLNTVLRAQSASARFYDHLDRLVQSEDAVSLLDAIIALAKADDWAAVSLRLKKGVRPLESITSELAESVGREVADEQARTLLNIERAEGRIRLMLPAAVLLTLILAAILAVAVTRSITAPLQGLVEASKALARGDFQHHVTARGEDELTHLGGVFDDAASRLRDLFDEVRGLKEEFRLAVDTIPGLVWSALPDGHIDFLNLRWREYTGLSLEEAGGWGWQTAIHPDDLPHLLEAWRGLLASGSSGEFEARIRRFDGTHRWFLHRAVPLRDEMGRVVKWYGQTTDIEDRKRNESALRRSEAMLAEAQRLTQTGSWRWRPATGEVEWSEETYRIYDIDPSSTPTLEMALERVLPEDRQVFVSTAERAVPEGKNLAFELRLLMKDGSLRYLRTVGQPIKDAAGQLIEFVGAVREMTKEKEAEEVLERLRAELAHVARVATLGELTASIAHEVNQPLSGIMTNASMCLRLLAAEPPDLVEAADTARRTLRDGRRAADVITRLRGLFSKKATAHERLDVNEAIHEVIALTRTQMQAARVALRTELADDLPPVVGDRVQLQQVVLNLVLNAAEAMSDVSGRPRDLVVATSLEADDQVRVAVRDCGVGFEPAEDKRIFEAFYTTKKDGMGMGLSIARSIVESHGGRLWAQRNEGPGATFLFTLSGRSAVAPLRQGPD